jgi:hypothetical protein
MTKVRTKKFKTYRVSYAVTRSELYEIKARSAQEAADTAFEEGALVETDTTDVVDCDLEEV